MLKKALLLVATLPLIGCDLSYDAALNPNEFGFEYDGGTMNGAYNPSGFTQSEVRGVLRDACTSPAIIGYNEVPSADGTIAFSAECAVSDFFDSEILGYRVTRGPTGLEVTSGTVGISFP